MHTTENIKIIYAEDYENTYRINIIKQFYVAFTTQDVNFILEHIENDVHWQIVDKALILGKEQFTKMIKQWAPLKIKTLHIKNIILHGRTAAVNGVLHSYGNKNHSFCDIYHFSNMGKHAKIQRISSYVNNLFLESYSENYHVASTARHN